MVFNDSRFLSLNKRFQINDYRYEFKLLTVKSRAENLIVTSADRLNQHYVAC